MFFFPFRLCAGGLRRHLAAPKGLPNRPNPRLVARIRTEGHQAFDIFRTYISLLGSYLDKGIEVREAVVTHLRFAQMVETLSLIHI